MREIILKKRYPHSREEDITDAFMRGYEKGKADRPQGEWQYVYKGRWMLRRCSCCDWTQTYDDSKYMGYRYNFCPNCGADMREREGE